MALAVDGAAWSGVGLPDEEVRRWVASEPVCDGDLARDAASASRFWLAGASLVGRLPARPQRSARAQTAVEALHAALRSVRARFLRQHGAELYDELTDGQRRAVRIEDLVYLAAERYPGLTPTKAQIAAEREHAQKDKDGAEIDQGVFLSHLLSLPRPGLHLVYAMLRPKPESLDLLPAFQRLGRLQLGPITVEREGNVGYLWHANPRFLNAEDDSVVPHLEVGTDLLLLDRNIEACVMRGKTVDHPKYAGRHVFNAGINLTNLYFGQISFVDFYLVRDMGYVHKLMRGVSPPEFWPHAVEDGLEKPWIAAVETFAIGGGCQLLLAMDYILAERSSYFNLPARKEGIIPGVSPMRLWRFVGDRAAREAILFDRQFPADSPAGQLICDEVVEDGAMDGALARVVESLTGSGVVSAASNRKAMRIGQESLDMFRQYMAMYCREQAYCHYSPQLILNLERYWNAQQRRL
jgi:thioesterase DpgC